MFQIRPKKLCFNTTTSLWVFIVLINLIIQISSIYSFGVESTSSLRRDNTYEDEEDIVNVEKSLDELLDRLYGELNTPQSSSSRSGGSSGSSSSSSSSRSSPWSFTGISGTTRTTDRFLEPRLANHGGDESAHHYMNEWLVYVPKGDEHANQLAMETGYVNLGQVRGFSQIYKMRHPDHPVAHSRMARELTEQLIADDRVTWADQLFVKERVKRNIADWKKILKDFRLGSFLHLSPNLNPNEARFNDRLWEKEWYLQDTRTNEALPRLDLNVLPVFDMGITGKGINVVILDDGLEHNHTDLIDNYNPKISFDLNDDDDDPMPHYDSVPISSHGTRCAGEVAMKANNSKCGVGIAFNCKIGGIRMLDGPVSDQVEGEGLAFALDQVDIFSASWGPSDNGQVVEGPGRLAQLAFLKGITQGRGGKGVNYIWASGNGGAKGDVCSCDGYASSIYTLSIGSASESGSFPWYGEMCPSTMAVTYSSGAYTDQKIATTDIKDTCTVSHTGTSASAPLAAGIVALTLEANPKLTWRDIQHLIVWTSQSNPLKDNLGWKKNKVGFEFNSRFGFGLMDAHGMVSTGQNWTNVTPQRICRVKSIPLKEKIIDPTIPKIAKFQTNGCEGTQDEINYLEHVEVLTTVHYSTRGDLNIELTSPQGTTTELLIPRKNDVSSTGFNAWPFMSVHTWGENPKGIWLFNLTDSTKNKENEGYLEDVTLVLYGTQEIPIQMKFGPRIYPKQYRRKSFIIKPIVHDHDHDDHEENMNVHRLEKILSNLDIQNWI